MREVDSVGWKRHGRWRRSMGRIAGGVVVAVVMVAAAAVSAVAAPVSDPASQVLRFDASDPTALQAAINDAYAAGVRKMTIPPGTYRVGPSSPGGPNLLLANMSDLRISADGVTLKFLDKLANGIEVLRGNHVSLTGGTFENAEMSFTQGVVDTVSSDGSSLTVTIDKGYPTDLTNPVDFPGGGGGADLFDPDTLRLKPRVQDLYPAAFTQLSPDSFRITLVSPRPGSAAPGDRIAIRGAGSKLVYIYQSTNTVVRGLTLHNGAGFAINDELGGHNTYSHISITRGNPPAGATVPPLYSAARDGLHSDGTRGGPQIDHLYIADNGDDGIAVHGNYYTVLSVSGRTAIVQRSVGQDFFGTFEPGDRVEGVDVGTANSLGLATVSASAPLADCPTGKQCYTLTLDRQLPVEPGDLIGNLDTSGQGFNITHTTIRDNRARGIIVKAGGTIADNHISGSTLGGIYVGPELNAQESGYVRGLTISDNSISGTGANIRGSGRLPMAAIDVHAGDIFSDPGPDDVFGNSDITITGNTVDSPGQVNLRLDAARNINVEHNRFIHAFEQQNPVGAAADLNSVVVTDRADQITFHHNLVIQPGANLQANLTRTSRTGELDGLPGGIRTVGP